MDRKTRYFKKILGGPFRPSSLVVVGSNPLTQIVILRSYLNWLFEYNAGMKMELWEDQSWFNLRYRKMLKTYHGANIKYYRPTKIFSRDNPADESIRKLYDEFVLRKSNRRSNASRIVYYDTHLAFSSRPTRVMYEEILADGGRLCNIQLIATCIPGSGALERGLLNKFDIKIATYPLLKADSKALFGTDEYASKKSLNKLVLSINNKVEIIDTPELDLHNQNNVFLNRITEWTF